MSEAFLLREGFAKFFNIKKFYIIDKLKNDFELFGKLI